jgi:hypothetical protein
MTEEPKQAAATSEVTDQKVTRWGPVMGFFRDHPTLVLSLLYLYATAMGIVYSFRLYRSFGINIFDYSEIADFLLAAFKNEWVLANLVGQASVVIAALSVWRFYEARGLSSMWLATCRLWLIGLTYTCIVVIVTYQTAISTASSIKYGETPAVDVWYRSFSGSAGQVKEPKLRLIGATQKAVFFYDVDAKSQRTIVIPQSQLVSMEVPEQD